MFFRNDQMQALLRAIRRSTPAAPAPSPKPPIWNSLEITKLLVSLLTPIAIAFATYQYNVHKDADVQQQERLKRVVSKRVDLWDEMAPKMNDIYCYFLFVGRWKELGPKDMLARKRDLDALLYANQILFSKEFFKSYEDFMNDAFQTYRGWGKDAGLQTRRMRPKDTELGEDSFTGTDNGDEVHKAYWHFQEMAATELDVPVLPVPPRPQKPDDKQIQPASGKKQELGIVTVTRSYYDVPSDPKRTPSVQRITADLDAPGMITDVSYSCAGSCGWLHQKSITKKGRTAFWEGERSGYGTSSVTFQITYIK